MLTAALRCPGKPVPADCEQRIGDQIKAERYIFGYLTKGPQAGQVTAEIHLFQKSKPDTVIRESYADNLKDQNDDTLQKIAQRMLDRLGGNAVGVIVVRMGAENGEVVVDGDKRVPLQNGTARLELSPGGHSVEVAVTGQNPQKRNVLVTAGKETIVDLAVAPTGDTKPDKPFPTRKVLGGGLVVLGAAAWTVAIITGLDHLAEKKRGEDYQKIAQGAPDNEEDPHRLPAGTTSIDQACDGSHAKFSNGTICDADSKATTASAIFYPTAIGGAVLLVAGAYFLFTDGSPDTEKGSSAAKKKPTVTPSVGYNSAGVVLSGSF